MSLTIAWLALVSLYFCAIADSTQLGQPNNLGDFLAGVFAPVAFFWLVLTALMQSKELALQRKELSLNREVLQLQAQELNHLVAQYAEQVILLKEAREEERGDRMAEGLDVAVQSFFRLFLSHHDQFVFVLKEEDWINSAENIFIQKKVYKSLFDASDWAGCSEHIAKTASKFRSFREREPNAVIQIEPGLWAHIELVLYDLRRLIRRAKDVRSARAAELVRSLQLTELRDEIIRISKLDSPTVKEAS